MTTTRTRVLGLIVMAAAAAGAGEPELPRWLEGRWVGTRGSTTFEELWIARGDALFGVHTDVRDGRAASWEFLRIAATSDGLAYFASPRSATPTVFTLVQQTGASVVFENPEHDFPQRIAYRLDESGALRARIEGLVGGRLESEEWSFERAGH